MSDIIVQALIMAGSIFILLAGVGVMRMPDLYMRLSTVTKGSTMGLGLILSAVLIELYSPTVLVKVMTVLVFGLVTSPLAAHLVSRASYFQGVALWEGTIVDELKGQYGMRDHELRSPEMSDSTAARVLGDDSADGEGRD